MNMGERLHKNIYGLFLNKYPAIDTFYSRLELLKFFAVSLIILFHYILGNTLSTSNFFFAWINNGTTGVSFFFVLSGFLLTFSALNKKLDYKTYIIHRIIRIIPLYYFIVLITFSIYRNTIDTQFVIGALLINVDLESYRSISILGPLWVISILFKFYLFFPFIYSEAKRNISYFAYSLIFLLLLKYFIFYAYPNLGTNFYFSFLGRLDQLLLGMLAAFLIKKRTYNLSLSIILMSLSLFILTSLFMKNTLINMYISTDLLKIYYSTIEGLLWGMFVVGFLLFPNKNNVNFVFFKNVGKITYPMLLIHIIVIDAIKNCYPNLRLINNSDINSVLISTTIILPITIILAIFAYKTVDKPFLFLKKSYTKI